MIVRNNKRYIGEERQRKLWVHCSFRTKSYSISIQRGQNCSMPTLSHSLQNKANYDQILANKVTGSVARRNAADIIKLGFTGAIDKILHHGPIRNATKYSRVSMWDLRTVSQLVLTNLPQCSPCSTGHDIGYFPFLSVTGPKIPLPFLKMIIEYIHCLSIANF